MVTGASTSQASIILVDARKGVIEQTYRHFFINDLLRVEEVVVAVNKMDLVNYSEESFNTIVADFKALAAKQNFTDQKITFIPISALKGDNVVMSSKAMSWYDGVTMLDHLENINPSKAVTTAARFPVQTVIRPKQDEYHDFRGYAGKVVGGSLAVGDTITVLPSGKTSTVKEIFFYDQSFEKAGPGSSCTITLNTEVNISRGDVLVKEKEAPELTKQFQATVCWMDTNALRSSTNYMIQQGTAQIKARVKNITSLIHTDFSGTEPTQQLELNEIGNVDIQLSKPLLLDSFTQNKNTGSFILIDEQTNATAGVGFIK